MGKRTFPPLPTRLRLVLAVYPALLYRVRPLVYNDFKLLTPCCVSTSTHLSIGPENYRIARGLCIATPAQLFAIKVPCIGQRWRGTTTMIENNDGDGEERRQ